MDDALPPILPEDPARLKQLVLDRDRRITELEKHNSKLEEDRDRRITELEKQKSDLEEDRDRRIAELEKQREELKKERDQKVAELELEKLRVLQQLTLLKKQYYGPRSDRVDLGQLLLEFGQELEARPVNPQDLPPGTEPADPKTVRRVKRGRRRLADLDLPTVDRIHDLPEDQKAGMTKIGQETTYQIERAPGFFYRVRHVQLKYARPDLEKAGENPQITLAEKPLQPIEKGMAGPGLLAYVVTSKFADYRVRGKAVFQMRAGLSWPGDRAGPQTSPNCGGQEPSWETSGANGVTRSRQVRSVKSNVSEPLMKCRKLISSTSEPESGSCSGMSVGGACNPAHAASGPKAARSRIRLGHGTLEPVASMPREKPKRRTREGESTDARHRGGTTRSSVEGRVMRLERRGRVIQSSGNRSTASAGGAHG